jgi:hypothetical protein
MSERRTDPADLWRDVADAVSGGIRRSIDFQRSVADDYERRFSTQRRVSSERDSKGWSELRSGVTEYGSAVFELTVDYYRDLAEAATRFVEQTYPMVVEGSRAMTDYGPGGRTPQRAAIEVRGAVGESVEARFSIENSDDEPAEVLIEAGTCRGPQGEGFSASVQLSPDALVIAPHSSDAVVATVDLAPSSFAPGGRYRLPISVHGPNPAIIELEITVDGESDALVGTKDGSNHTVTHTVTHTVRCPSCHRTFERTTPSVVLRPHNDDAGNPCPERHGKRVR